MREQRIIPTAVPTISGEQRIFRSQGHQIRRPLVGYGHGNPVVGARASIYRSFESKDDLFLALFKAGYEHEMSRLVATLEASDVPPAERLSPVGLRLLDPRREPGGCHLADPPVGVLPLCRPESPGTGTLGRHPRRGRRGVGRPTSHPDGRGGHGAFRGPQTGRSCHRSALPRHQSSSGHAARRRRRTGCSRSPSNSSHAISELQSGEIEPHLIEASVSDTVRAVGP